MIDYPVFEKMTTEEKWELLIKTAEVIYRQDDVLARYKAAIESLIKATNSMCDIIADTNVLKNAQERLENTSIQYHQKYKKEK